MKGHRGKELAVEKSFADFMISAISYMSSVCLPDKPVNFVMAEIALAFKTSQAGAGQGEIRLNNTTSAFLFPITLEIWCLLRTAAR